jgi:phage tail-like protein
MASFSVNPQRFDPYKNFKFRVKWDGRYVAGVSKVSTLKRTTEVVKHREGGDPSSSRKSPGRTEYDAITLERGVTHDSEFEKWANKIWNYGSGLGAETSLADFRKDITVELYNEAGQLALPDLDANANAVAIARLKLENEGWERDYGVTEPAEPVFTEPPV